VTAAPIRLLLLEDSADDAQLVQTALAKHAPGGFAVAWVERLADALQRLDSARVDAVLCDLGLPDSTGLATARALAAHAPAVPLVVLTGSHDEELGREAIHHGAQDYLVKDEVRGSMLARALRWAIERKRHEIELSTANQALERRVDARTAELTVTNEIMRDNSERLQALSWRLLTVEEAERRNINRELHDRVGQNLAALNININIIRSQLPPAALETVGTRLQLMQALLEETSLQIRDIMADLHPPALDDYGLLAALRTYVEATSARCAVPIAVQGEDLAPRLPLIAESALLRIAQGALVNAIKHAQAHAIEVVLAATPARVTLSIADDGIGFDLNLTRTTPASPARAHWGLAIMRERAKAVGAVLSIESQPQHGTRVVVEIGREKDRV
jgi:signal transduction histidine kinase